MIQADAAKLLGVSVAATAGDVRAAFAKWVKLLHPDTANPAMALGGPAMAQLKEARDCLLKGPAPFRKPCPICKDTGTVPQGLRLVPCVKGCQSSSW